MTSSMIYEKFRNKKNYKINKNAYKLALKRGYFKLAHWIGNKKLVGYFEYHPRLMIDLKDHVPNLIVEKEYQRLIISSIIKRKLKSSNLNGLLDDCTLYSNNELLDWILNENKLKNFDAYNIFRIYINGNIEGYKILEKHGFEHKKTSTMAEAIGKNGNIEMLKLIIEPSLLKSICNGAFECGHINIIESIEIEYDYKYSEFSGSLCIAAEKGRLETIKWAVNRGDIVPPEVFSSAVESNNLELLEYLKNQGVSFDSQDLKSALFSANVDTLNWLKKNNYPMILPNQQYDLHINTAKDFDKLKWFIDEKLTILKDNICFCCVGANKAEVKRITEEENCDHVDTSNNVTFIIHFSDITVVMIKWLMDNGWQEPNECFYSALGYIGNIEIFKFLKEKECDIEPVLASSATYCGNIKMLELYKSYNLKFDKYTHSSAILNGDPDIIDWVEKNVSERNQDACEYATIAGNCQLLESLVKQGYKLTSICMQYAFEKKHWRTLQYLVTNYCRADKNILKKAGKLGVL